MDYKSLVYKEDNKIIKSRTIIEITLGYHISNLLSIEHNLNGAIIVKFKERVIIITYLSMKILNLSYPVMEIHPDRYKAAIFKESFIAFTLEELHNDIKYYATNIQMAEMLNEPKEYKTDYDFGGMQFKLLKNRFSPSSKLIT